MKKPLKITYVWVLTLVLTIFGCNNDDEGPLTNKINIEDLTISIDENPTDGQSIGTVQTNGDGALSFSIMAQTPADALSVNSNTGEITVADASLFDYEINPVLTATISVNGAVNTSAVTINLNDVNEIGVQDLEVAIDENPTAGESVGTVQVSGQGPFSFNITSQTPAGALDINASTGEITVADAMLFDFETNPVFTANVSVVGAPNPSNVTIELKDLVEISTPDLTVTIDENPTDGQVLGLIEVEGSAPLSFTITSQTPADALQINTSTGELTVTHPNLFDFETNPVITADISVDNSVHTASTTATINLNDVDEITVQDLTADVDENPMNGQVIGAIQASSSGSLAYAITYQSTAGALSIDQNTGELSVAGETLFDFETNPNVFAVISIENGVSTINANATINLNNIDEIGDFNYGGVIFWLDGNGGGLVCDIVDQVNPTPNQGIGWSIGANTITGASATAIGTGQANTTAIVNNHGTGVYAAALCDNLTTGGYSDWYLPSLFELHEIYFNMAEISTTAQANGGNELIGLYHWSSTEMNVDQARVVSFNGTTFSDFSSGKNNSGALVRAVRTF